MHRKGGHIANLYSGLSKKIQLAKRGITDKQTKVDKNKKIYYEESLGKSRCKEMCLVEKCWIAGQKDMLLCIGIEYAGTGFLGDIMLSIGFVAVNIPLGGQKDLSNKEYS